MGRGTAGAGVLLCGLLAAFGARGDAPPKRYTLAAETVKDEKTGLTWQRAVPATTYSRVDALAYCQGLNLGGFSTGWRAPTKKELESLVDRSVAPPGPTLDAAAFPSTPAENFWSATPSADDPKIGWVVFFGSGDSSRMHGTFLHRIRCVR